MIDKMTNKLHIIISKLKNYFMSHIWCFFIMLIVLGIIVVVPMQRYLKREYVSYLWNETYATEQTLLNSAQQNLVVLLDDCITIGCEIAINENLYKSANAYTAASMVDKASKEQFIKNCLSLSAHYSRWIVNISIASEDGMIYQYDRYAITNAKLWDEDNSYILSEMAHEIFVNTSNRTIPKYSVRTEPANHPNMKSLNMFHMGFPLMGDKSFDDVKYAVIISFDAEALYEFLSSVSQNKDGYSYGYITDKAGNIVFSVDKDVIGLSQQFYIKEEKLFNISEPVGKLDWAFNIAIDERKLLDQINDIYYKENVSYFIALGVVFFLLCAIINSILKPVKEINKSISLAVKGNLNRRIKVKGEHEIWQMAENFNSMMYSLKEMNLRIDENHKDIIISMNKRQRAERDALESQINAHFIFNTLNVINYEALEAKNFKVSILIKKLSNILRYSFTQKNQNVYMIQEIAWIEQYLYLQKSRLEDVFDYEIDFPETLGDWPCRKLMLQPFVENSILHGFEGMQKNGQIRIKASLEKDRLKLLISDNGKGMNQDTVKVLKEILIDPVKPPSDTIGIGISNVITRMKMYYKDDLEVELNSELGKGTLFTFLIPMPK